MSITDKQLSPQEREGSHRATLGLVEAGQCSLSCDVFFATRLRVDPNAGAGMDPLHS